MSDATVSAVASGTFLIGGDLPVYRMGYGTMRLVGEGAWGEPEDADEAKHVLRRAVELGVDLVDTADAYGPEIAERLICEALHPYPAGLLIDVHGQKKDPTVLMRGTRNGRSVGRLLERAGAPAVTGTKGGALVPRRVR